MIDIDFLHVLQRQECHDHPWKKSVADGGESSADSFSCVIRYKFRQPIRTIILETNNINKTQRETSVYQDGDNNEDNKCISVESSRTICTSIQKDPLLDSIHKWMKY